MTGRGEARSAEEIHLRDAIHMSLPGKKRDAPQYLRIVIAGFDPAIHRTKSKSPGASPGFCLGVCPTPLVPAKAGTQNFKCRTRPRADLFLR